MLLLLTNVADRFTTVLFVNEKFRRRRVEKKICFPIEDIHSIAGRNSRTLSICARIKLQMMSFFFYWSRYRILLIILVEYIH